MVINILPKFKNSNTDCFLLLLFKFIFQVAEISESVKEMLMEVQKKDDEILAAFTKEPVPSSSDHPLADVMMICVLAFLSKWFMN